MGDTTTKNIKGADCRKKWMLLKSSETETKAKKHSLVDEAKVKRNCLARGTYFAATNWVNGLYQQHCSKCSGYLKTKEMYVGYL